MNTETCLEIQASVDGELDASRRATVERLCATDPNARRLSEQLTLLRDALRANEPEYRVSDTREFYWGQIQRRIAAETARDSASDRHAAPVQSWTESSWIRWLVPLAGVAAVLALVTLPNNDAPATTTLASISPAPSGSAAASSVIYRSDTDGVTVHWIN